MGNQIIGTTIQVVSSNDMVASLYDILQGVGDGSSTRSYCQSCYTTFECSHAIFEYALCRISESSIYITSVAQTETVGSMLGVAEYV